MRQSLLRPGDGLPRHTDGTVDENSSGMISDAALRERLQYEMMGRYMDESERAKANPGLYREEVALRHEREREVAVAVQVRQKRNFVVLVTSAVLVVVILAIAVLIVRC